MRRLLHHADKIGLVACVLLFLASALWAAMRLRHIEDIAGLNAAGGISSARYEPQPVPMPTIPPVFWPEPPAQSAPRRWVYDAFTPPVIYFNPQTREFTVTRPEMKLPVVDTTEAPFEVELVRVRQEPYRIQLVGYAGNDADYIAHIQIVDTGEVVLARPGANYGEAKGDFTLRSFDVRRVTTNSSDSMPVVETVGFATVLDGRTGREVTLTTHERLMLPHLQCVLRTRVYPPEEHVLREGMKITVNGYEYLVVQLSLHPAQAVVSRRDPRNLVGENRTLFPVASDGSRANPAPSSMSDERDNSIDSPRVSLFSNSRRLPLVDHPRLPTQ